jgi:hypothetical protein
VVAIADQQRFRWLIPATGSLRIESVSGRRACLRSAAGHHLIELPAAWPITTTVDACAGLTPSAAATALPSASRSQSARAATVAAATPPAPSGSLYVYAAYLNPCGATATWGCPLYVAGARAPVPAGGGLDILDFGAPCFSGSVGSEVYGTQLFGSATCTGDAQLVPLAQAWLRGYESAHAPGSPSTILGAGTSNSLTAAVPGNALSTAQLQAHAAAWYSSVVQPLATAASGQAPPVTVWAGSDIEQSGSGDWYGPTDSRAWVDAYGTASGITSRNCSATGAGSLANYGDNVVGAGGWTSADIYHVAWEVPAVCPVPEIYYPSMATSWQNLNNWAVTQQKPGIQFTGVMSEDGVDGTLSASGSWLALQSATNQSAPFDTIIGLTTMTSTRQYSLANSDGSTWVAIDPVRLREVITPSSAVTAILSGNADLWTANAGYNQDLGIFVDDGTVDRLLAWKESGGRGATFSPNAAFVQGVIVMSAGVTYTVTLKWKTNRSAIGATIFAGAGLGPAFSPTSLASHLLPGPNPANLYAASSTQQYRMANSDGTTWQEVDSSGALRFQISTTSSATAILRGNADLWTANGGVNQDIGIWISGGRFGTTGQLVAWKESGGNAGTFSPNAAFVQAVVPLDAGVTYTVSLRWKANHQTSGTIFIGAGGASPFSPTSLVGELVAAANVASSAIVTQPILADSDGATWQPVDPALTAPPVTPAGDTLALVSGNADLWTANAGFDQDLGIFVTVDGAAERLVAWKESGGYGGIFSPNAAFVESLFPMSAGSTYVFTLKWKANHAATGATIYAGAGAGTPHSPTRLSVQLISG